MSRAVRRLIGGRVFDEPSNLSKPGRSTRSSSSTWTASFAPLLSSLSSSSVLSGPAEHPHPRPRRPHKRERYAAPLRNDAGRRQRLPARADRRADPRGKEASPGARCAPFPNIPFWLRRGEGERLEHDAEREPIAVEAVRLRAEGATVKEVRAFLTEHGIRLSFHGVQSFLTSRLLLGELHFGAFSNLEGFPPLVDVETFNRVQRLRLPRGRRPKSERLSVLSCATCGARQVVGARTTGKKRYEHYRCPPVGDCPQRVTISADLAEAAVEHEVRQALTGMKGKASAATAPRKLRGEVERRQAELDSATRTLCRRGPPRGGGCHRAPNRPAARRGTKRPGSWMN